jgi:hypothetical protein
MQNTKEIHNEQPATGSPSQFGQGNPTQDKKSPEKQGQQSGQQMPKKDVHDDLKKQDQQKTGTR